MYVTYAGNKSTREGCVPYRGSSLPETPGSLYLRLRLVVPISNLGRKTTCSPSPSTRTHTPRFTLTCPTRISLQVACSSEGALRSAKQTRDMAVGDRGDKDKKRDGGGLGG